MKQYTIPFFTPLKGCPNKCIFCDQNRITGEDEPDPAEVPVKIEKYLATIQEQTAHIEVGFFGGSFTGLPVGIQQGLLEKVGPFIKNGFVHGIRISTRPDLIDREKVKFLKDRGITCIELGIQSMSDKVLKAAKRGHNAEHVRIASGLIVDAGIELCHQVMIGLPESSYSDELFTAEQVKILRASQVRIYPVLVIKDTELALQWEKKKYIPLEISEAVERAAGLIVYFESNNIKVIRCGLHPSASLSAAYLAGPFHPAFGQKARFRAKEMV